MWNMVLRPKQPASSSLLANGRQKQASWLLAFPPEKEGMERVTGPHLRLQLFLQFCPNYTAGGEERSKEDLESVT